MNLRRPEPADVLDAHERLEGIAIRTPLLRSDELDARVGGKVFFKCENLQRSGAFKFRGAYNCLSRLDRQAYPGGVVAYSTGNHGQAVATVGRMLGIPSTIVMPYDAPSVKIAKARAQGAQVVLYDRRTARREEIAARIADANPVAIIPPGDDPFVIAGQGTVAGEALQALSGANVDVVLVPCGGGGLAAGTCLAVEAFRSKAEVWAAEPLAFDDTKRSLASGQREKNPRLDGSICDALLAPTPAVLPFAINRERLARVLVADDRQVLEAMRFVYEELRVVVEPGGAVGLAALLANPEALRGRSAVVVASGGNVDTGLFMRALQSAGDRVAA
ncbi:threonine/serine dehydratase [Bradyrhizobium sp. AUGA SZCCT0222]|uniref:threonine/serine dehydratase n=1 Tax=Bradyrhizobium sp. AUGA SZCCT0222 TaxID=2807668 RepID=UPI001BA6A288|nr:threonine/serine dehydratase [Bradyrhizobium sp. AUGA SZCCT0222]MBR1267760.1 threonine/serine dehydratase [Bradyrhizobium sp. AUGA SZCCT0222]